MDFFGKCEQICNLLRVAYMIILAKRNPRGVEGRDFVSCAVPGIIPGDALVLVIKRTVEHRSELLLFRCFHFRLDRTNHLQFFTLTSRVTRERYQMKRHSSVGSLQRELYSLVFCLLILFCLFILFYFLFILFIYFILSIYLLSFCFLLFGYSRIVEILQNE